MNAVEFPNNYTTREVLFQSFDEKLSGPSSPSVFTQPEGKGGWNVV